MKKLLLTLVAACLLTSCAEKTASDKICDFIESAIEKTEDAKSLNELNTINERLTQNITVYTLSWSKEEYQKWEADKDGALKIENLKFKYKEALKAKEKELKGE